MTSDKKDVTVLESPCDRPADVRAVDPSTNVSVLVASSANTVDTATDDCETLGDDVRSSLFDDIAEKVHPDERAPEIAVLGDLTRRVLSSNDVIAVVVSDAKQALDSSLLSDMSGTRVAVLLP